MDFARQIQPEEVGRTAPIYAVWEITLRCDHACAHCGSRAGAAREQELTTEQLLTVADQVAELGFREVTLIGGEAYLRRDCPQVIERLVARGVRVTMQTGGRGLRPDVVRRLGEAGLAAVGVSIDGLRPVHDELRASPGSHQAALQALANAREVGLLTTVNSQINRLNKHELRAMRDMFRRHDVRVWRCQLTAPMGRAADRPEWLLEPWAIMQVMDDLAELQLEEVQRAKDAGVPVRMSMRIMAGNNLGYYGPHEMVLRSHPGRDALWWTGCKAGRHTIGIESDGTVKPCPSLPTAPYISGNILDHDLASLWQGRGQMGFVRERSTDELWGFCGTCEYGSTCMAGCSFTAHTALGRRGNMPWCYHRAATLKKRGRRERLRRVQAASGAPYDFGRFEIVEEDWEE